MKVEKAVMELLDQGKLSRNMDCYVLELPNGREVSFVDRDGDVDEVSIHRKGDETSHFGTRLFDAIRTARTEA